MTANLKHFYEPLENISDLDVQDSMIALHAYMDCVNKNAESAKYLLNLAETYTEKFYDEELIKNCLDGISDTYNSLLSEAFGGQGNKKKEPSSSFEEGELTSIDRFFRPYRSAGWFYKKTLDLYKDHKEQLDLHGALKQMYRDELDRNWQPTGAINVTENYPQAELKRVRDWHEKNNGHIGLQALVLFWAYVSVELRHKSTPDYNFVRLDYTVEYFEIENQLEKIFGPFPNYLSLLFLYNKASFLALHNSLLSLGHGESDAKLILKDSELYFKDEPLGLEIRGSETKQHLLLNTLIKDPYKRWSVDEIWLDWGDENSENHGAPYWATRCLNKRIAEKTQVIDFIEHNGKKEFWINEKYLVD